MLLLGAKEIEASKKAGGDDKHKLIKKYAEEENTLAKRLNTLRVEVKKEKEKLTISKATSEAQLNVKKTVLAEEVDLLESRKSDALIPVDVEWEKVKKHGKDLEEQKNMVIAKESAIKTREVGVVEKETNLEKRKGEVQAKQTELNAREKEVVKIEREIIARIKVLNKEKTELTEAIKVDRQTGIDESTQLETDIATKKAELKVAEEALVSEIKVLEKRKVEALLPLSELKKKLEEERQELQEQINLMLKEKELVRIDREELVAQAQGVADREGEIKEETNALVSREVMVKASENETKKSLKSLGAKWKEYHEAVLMHNDEYMVQNKDITAREESIKAKIDIVKTKEGDLGTREKRLTDGRETLHRATQDFKTKQQKDG